MSKFSVGEVVELVDLSFRLWTYIVSEHDVCIVLKTFKTAKSQLTEIFFLIWLLNLSFQYDGLQWLPIWRNRLCGSFLWVFCTENFEHSFSLLYSELYDRSTDNVHREYEKFWVILYRSKIDSLITKYDFFFSLAVNFFFTPGSCYCEYVEWDVESRRIFGWLKVSDEWSAFGFL